MRAKPERRNKGVPDKSKLPVILSEGWGSGRERRIAALLVDLPRICAEILPAHPSPRPLASKKLPVFMRVFAPEARRRIAGGGAPRHHRKGTTEKGCTPEACWVYVRPAWAQNRR